MTNSLGAPNLRIYKNSFDYSLDQIKLREVYEKVYRNTRFSFKIDEKDYTNRVINMTFKYSVAEFNKFGKTGYVKLGYCERDAQFEDSIWKHNGEIVGVITETPVEHLIPEDELPNGFEIKDNQYIVTKIKTVVDTATLRRNLYSDGFVCGDTKFIRWKRSSGSSRVGKCLFIDEKLYHRMHKWEMCGLKIKDGQEVDLAALESYISLPSSSIIDTIQIEPKNILVIPDYESVFVDDVVSVEDHDGKLTAERKNCEIKNSIFDGQGLIDHEAMGDYKYKGMILLRNLFFKCCCFNTNIQQWFADNNITQIEQLNGFTLAEDIKDIKLITTPSSIKYIKFGKLETWLKTIDSTFGVVKYDKPTHFENGKMVQTHYQLLNTLQMTPKEVEEFVKPSLDYLTLIKNDIDALRRHIKFPVNSGTQDEAATSKNEIVYKLLGINNKFAQTKMYYEFKRELVKSFLKDLKLGHVLVEGNYSTLFGNPIEMLLQSIGKFDGTSQLGVGNVCTKRFDYETTLLGSRSPHISMSNILITQNTKNEQIDKYFNLTKQIVCVNSINENILQKLSGADFDSDTILITNDKYLIAAAEKTYSKFPIAVCNVSSIKNKRYYTTEQKTDLDIKTCNNLIGDIINLSQELNTIVWDKIKHGGTYESVMPIYLDVCKLNIASGLEIDKAKKNSQ